MRRCRPASDRRDAAPIVVGACCQRSPVTGQTEIDATGETTDDDRSA